MAERAFAPGLAVKARRTGSAALLGGAFAVVAAPCIGTVLASILVLAGSSGVARGVVLLLAYSLGLGAAFVLAGVAFAHAMRWFRWVRSHYQALRIVSGATLITLGLLLFFNKDWWLRVRALPGFCESRPQHLLALALASSRGRWRGSCSSGSTSFFAESSKRCFLAIVSRPSTASIRPIS